MASYYFSRPRGSVCVCACTMKEERIAPLKLMGRDEKYWEKIAYERTTTEETITTPLKSIGEMRKLEKEKEQEKIKRKKIFKGGGERERKGKDKKV